MLDAHRVSDGQVVILKTVDLKLFPQEIEIHRHLTAMEDERNHTVPILDWFQDTSDPALAFAVLPLLREIHHPPPASISECLDFVRQTIEVSSIS